MRAGAFAEKRVIDLLNRRFVTFYFNTGGPGLGLDPDAAAFVKGKVKNKWAFLAAFTPEGKYLDESQIYSDKDKTFTWLRDLLKAHPKHAESTPAEQKILESGNEEAARLFEALGDYPSARKLYEGQKNVAALARLARYDRNWDELEKLLPSLKGDDASAERGYALLARKKYADAREALETAIKEHSTSKRMAELRFSAGVACWFLDDKARAHFQWVWVVRNLPEDRLARRCYVAASAEGMPYENPELDGYAIEGSTCSIEMIKAAYRKAERDYERLKGE
jgi:tetratricopeptide (TPR) repeat protein